MLRWKAACGRLIAFVRAHLDVLLLFGTLLGVSSPASAQNCSGQPAANTVCAGPPSGPAGLPSFRAPVSADVPPINLGSSGRGGVTGNLPPGNLDSGTNANAHAY